jgi:peptidyl-dipeptidase A
MASSRNYDELLWAWKGWSEATGPKMKHLYTESIALQNKAAKDYGYNDLSEYWMKDFETDNFEKVADEIYEQLKPFYQQLHAYARRKLRNFYGADKVKSRLIPAHLLGNCSQVESNRILKMFVKLKGNMWAQSWDSVYDILSPYPDVAAIRVTEALEAKGFTPLKIFQVINCFFNVC